MDYISVMARQTEPPRKMLELNKEQAAEVHQLWLEVKGQAKLKITKKMLSQAIVGTFFAMPAQERVTQVKLQLSRILVDEPRGCPLPRQHVPAKLPAPTGKPALGLAGASSGVRRVLWPLSYPPAWPLLAAAA